MLFAMRFFNYLMAQCVIAFIEIMRAIPASICIRLGRYLGLIAHFLRIRYSILMKNLIIAFPEKSNEERQRLARKIYLQFGNFLGEWLSFKKRGFEAIQETVGIESETLLLAAFNEKRGLIIYTAHLGNWELGGWFFAHHTAPCYAVMNRLRNEWLDQMFERLHSESDVQTIYKGQSVPQIHAVLDHGGSVGMLADQSAGGHGEFVEFFGRPTSFHRGPALISIEKQCALFSAFVVPNGKGKWIIRQRRLNTQPSGDLNADVHRIVTEYAQHLEEIIREYPEYWFWFHNRWKATPLKASQC